MDRSRRYRSPRLGAPTVIAGIIWIGLLALEGAGLALAARNDVPDRTFYTALAIAFAAIAGVGVLIVSRRPRNAIGWLFLARW